MKKIKLCVAAVAAAMTVALSGCGTPNSTVEAGAPTSAQAFDATIAKVYGTTPQRAAAAEAGWLRTQLAVQECMSGKGLEYTPAPYQQLPDTGVAPGDLLAFAPARTDFGVARRVQAFAAAGDFAQPALAGASEETADKFAAAVSECATGDIQDAGNPKGQEVLDGQLVAALSVVEKKVLPDLAGTYKTCLAGKGFPAANLSDLYVKVEQKFPPISYEHKSDATKAPGWAEAVEFEKKAAAADAGCRADAVDTALMAAEPALAEFTARNSAAIEQVAAGWAAAEHDVAELRARLK